MIVEGLCTTRNPNGTINIAPMGPIVDVGLSSFLFRPFHTSTTFANLQATGCGVFHVTDDVQLIARAAVGKLSELPPLQPATVVSGSVIADACRWYEFEVVSIDATRQRTEIETRIVHTGWLRDFWGFNRAKHAVLETAILATRLHLLPPVEVREQLDRFAVIVSKTAGEQEQSAFEFLKSFIEANSKTPTGQ